MKGEGGGKGPKRPWRPRAPSGGGPEDVVRSRRRPYAASLARPAVADLETVARRLCLQNAVQHGGTCRPKALMGRVLGMDPELRSDPKAVMAALLAAGEAVNAMPPQAQRAALEAEAPDLLEVRTKARRTGLPPLPGAEAGKVVLRFAPNPNGPLSLGHGRGVSILAEYARMHDADLVLRFDDTDPQVKPPLWDVAKGWNGYDMVREDFEWLAGMGPTREVKASDRIGAYQDAARELIRRGGAYVCDCAPETWRNLKNAATPCEHREREPETHLAAFGRMVAGEAEAGTVVLRVKTDIAHKDPALRDWTAFRVVARTAVHPRARAGEIEDHRCWPLLDFESAVEDHAQGVTHVVRGKDLMDSTKKQAFLYEHMGWTYPRTLYWGRVSVHESGRFSTSMMRRGIEEGRFEGWDDPRLPTLRALRRRGFDPEAIRSFWVGLGLTEKDIAVSMENLEAEDAKRIDDRAPRFFFVPDPRAVSLSGAEGLVAEPLVHPNHPERGRRTLPAASTVHLAAEDARHPQVRLKDLGNIVLAGGSAFLSGTELDRSMPIVQWLPRDHAAPFSVVVPGVLPEDAEEGAVPDLRRVEGLVEPAALEHVGEVVQFERFGFVRIESPDQAVWLHD